MDRHEVLAFFGEGMMGAFITEASAGTVRGQIGCLSMMGEISPGRGYKIGQEAAYKATYTSERGRSGM